MSIPSPSEPVHAWLAQLPAQHAPAVAALRALIGAAAPGAHEIVYHGALGYEPTDAGFDRILYIAIRSAEDCANPALPPLLEQEWADGLRFVARRHGR